MTFATRFAGFLFAACLSFGVSSLTPSFGQELLVANKSDHTLQRIRLSDGAVTHTWPTGRAPHEIAVNQERTLAAVSDYGDRRQAGSSLTIIDLRQNKVSATVSLGKHRRPHGMAWLDDQILVTTEGSAHVIWVDPQKSAVVAEVATDQAISHMLSVTPDLRRGFVANIGAGTVSVIDLEKRVKLRDIPTGDGAEGVAVTPNGKEVWVGNRSADTISILDAETLEILATLPCPGFPIRVAISPNGKHALLSLARTGEIARFDVATRKEIIRSKLDLKTVPGAAKRLFGDRFGQSPVPVGIAISEDSLHAWVAATQSDVVVGFDLETLEVTQLLRAGSEPDGIAWLP